MFQMRGKHTVLWAMVVSVGVGSAACGRDHDEVAAGPEAHPVHFEETRLAQEALVAEDASDDAETAALKAALLGGPKPEPVEEAPEPAKKAPRRGARRAPIDEEPVAYLGGGLSDHDFQTTIGSWRGMKSCLSEMTLRTDDRSGALNIALTIRGDGTVVDSAVKDTSTVVAQAIAPCVEKRARRMKFPAFAGNDQVTKVAKFVF